LIFIDLRPKKQGKILKKGGGIVKKTPLNKKIAVGKVTDARLKLIKKNRVAIKDAREKISQVHRNTIRDARELLSKKKKPVVRKAHIPRSRGPRLSMDEQLLVDEDDMEIDDISTFKTKPLSSLRRTVQNDIYRQRPAITPPRMPRLPTFSIQNTRDPSPPHLPDPFDCYNVPTRRPVPPPPIPRAERYQTAGRPMSAHMDAYDLPRKSILRGATRSGAALTLSGGDHDDRFESDRYISSESRLSSSHYPSESAGIFASSHLRRPSPPPIAAGVRVIVSNLDPSISESDIRELFEDVGQLHGARLIRPGSAEVIYQNQGDAEIAVETYHNRQLDGRPMKVHTSSSYKSSSSQYRM
jgi:polymerase delta-interacting protein 3